MNRYRELITDQRYDEIVKIVSEKGLKVKSSDFTSDEIMKIIAPAACLSEDQLVLCVDKYIHHLSFDVLSEKNNVAVSTMKGRAKALSLKMRTACTRIFGRDESVN